MAERSGDQAANGLSTLTKELPTDRLVEEAQNLLAALGERAIAGVTDKIEDLAEGDGFGGGLKAKAALAGGKALLSEGTSQVKSVVGGGLSQATEKVKDTLSGDKGGNKGKGKKLKVINIVEQIDVGVPVTTAYNQWTQSEDFPSFMKKVEDVEQKTETESDWKAQIFLSHRMWHSTVIEQVPDERIVWESKGAKGHVDGAVTFHEVAPALTRILLVLEYHPQGLFERTGNIWRAQGRRARLELKNYRRHVMRMGILHPEEIEGWRGEVHDGEVVRSDEEVREDEEQQASEEPEDQELEDEDQELEDEQLEDEEPRDEEVDEEEEDDGGEDEGEEGEVAEDAEEGQNEKRTGRRRRRSSSEGR